MIKARFSRHFAASTFRSSVARFVLAASLIALSTTPARSIMYNRDVGDQLSQELASRIEFDSKARMGGCSAVLIAPDAALSAAHCVGYQETGKVGITWNGQSQSGTFWKHPQVDLIVVKLDGAFDKAEVTPPYAGREEEGRQVWKVGQGGNGVLGPGGTPPKYDNVFRAMSNRIEVDRKEKISAVTETEIRYDFDGPPSEPYTSTGTEFEGGTAPGDSGGPMYMREKNGKLFVIGVTSGPRDNYYADGRVSTCVPFIEEKTGHVFHDNTAPNLTPPAKLPLK